MELDRIVLKAMAKSPDERYQHVDEMIVDLRGLDKKSAPVQAAAPSAAGPGRTTSPAVPKTTSPSDIRLRAVLGLAAIVVLVAGALAFWSLRESPSMGEPRTASVVVLPLTNLSGDPDQEYFSDGMTEALISELSKISALKVISRTSAMRYKSTDKSVPEIARELDVGAVVEGSVLLVEGQVRITANLVEASASGVSGARATSGR